MFHMNADKGRFRLSKIMTVAIVFLGLALALGAAAGYQVWTDYRLIVRRLDRGGVLSVREIDSLRNESAVWSFVITLGAVFLLISVAASLVALRRRIKNRSIEKSILAATDYLESANERDSKTDSSRVQSITRVISSRSRENDFELRPDSLDRRRAVESTRGNMFFDRSFGSGSAGDIGFLRPLDAKGDLPITEDRVRRMQRFIDLMGIAAAGMNHEIRNPLTALSLHIQLLEERIRDEAISSDLSELIGVVNEEVHKLDKVLGGFRDLACSGGIEPTPVDVVALASETIKLIEPAAARQKVDVVFHRPYENSLIVTLDHEIFKHALLNLAIGSLEATPDGGELTFAAAVDDDELRFDVSDTGVSVPPSVRRELFQPYFTVLGLGAGMGLARAETLIGRHGGRVEFKPSPSKTTFRLAIPLSPGVEPVIEKEALI